MTDYTENLFTKEELIKMHRDMVALGPRLTGSAAHESFIDFVQKQLEGMGFEVKTDRHTMKRWEPKKWGLTYTDDSKKVTALKTAYYPYSGCTPEDGITAKMKWCGKPVSAFWGARGKIAVVSMPVFEAGCGVVFKKRCCYPDSFIPPKKQGSPVVATFVIAPFLSLAKLAGAKGVVCVMTNCSDDCAQDQYLPFIKQYTGMPAVWVNETEGKEIIACAKRKEEATLTLDAKVFDNAPTRTIYAILPGKSDKKTILINTHTDGSNAFEENAALGTLSLAKYFASKPIEEREHTLVFSFVTGHFQLHQFGSGIKQATGKFLDAHPELWAGNKRDRSGKKGYATATAGVTLEHLGCTEWRDNADHSEFVKLNDVDPELVYTSNKIMSDIYVSVLKERTLTRTLMLRPKNLVHFGEGQPLYRYGIPSISLCPGPDYLCNVAPSGYIEKTNYDLMVEQIDSFRRVVEILDKKERKDLGRKQGFAWGFKF